MLSKKEVACRVPHAVELCALVSWDVKVERSKLLLLSREVRDLSAVGDSCVRLVYSLTLPRTVCERVLARNLVEDEAESGWDP